MLFIMIYGDLERFRAMVHMDLVSPCTLQADVLTGDFLEKGFLKNTSPSNRGPPHLLKNKSLRNPKWLPTKK